MLPKKDPSKLKRMAYNELNNSKTTTSHGLNIWAIGLSLGLKIALPLVISVLLAIKLDKAWNTLPLLTIIAMVGSFIISTFLISRDIKRVTHKSEDTATKHKP